MSDKSVSFALKVLSLCFFAMGTASLSVVGALESISSALGISRSEAALLVPAFAVTFAVAAPAIQLVAGHWVRRHLLLCGLIILGAGALGCALAPNDPVLIAARILTGLGAAAISPMVSSLAAALVTPQRQGHALAVVFSGMTIASVRRDGCRWLHCRESRAGSGIDGAAGDIDRTGRTEFAFDAGIDAQGMQRWSACRVNVRRETTA